MQCAVAERWRVRDPTLCTGRYDGIVGIPTIQPAFRHIMFYSQVKHKRIAIFVNHYLVTKLMKKHYLLNFKEIGERFFSLYGDYSRDDLAALFGVGPSAISDWRNNRKKVPWDKLVFAVQTKGVTWDWLLEGREPKYRNPGVKS